MIAQKFSKSYDDVLTQSYLFHSGLLRDLSLFTAYSPLFTVAYASDFLDLIEAAGELPTNEEDLNNQVILSLDLDSKLEDARLLYRKLISYVNLKWGNNDVALRAFGSNLYDKARQSPPKMVNLLELANRAAESSKYKTDLIAVGFTQLDITALLTLSAELNTIYNNQQEFIQLTSDRAEERVIAFNKVWDVMVQINFASKQVFKDSPALIEYYLLYPEGPGPGALTAPTGLSFTISNMKISWNSVTNATSYIASISTDGGTSYQEVYSGSDTFFVYEPTYFGEVSVLIKGHNSGGNGPTSDPYKFTYFDILPAPEGLTISLVSETTGLIRLNFEEVASATTYKIFRSVVGLGMPAGEYVYITEQAGTEYVGNTTADMRNYFYVKAGNATQLSVASSAVFMDMAVVPE